MSVGIQLVKNNSPLPALFVEKDLHLNKLIAATVDAVNNWAKYSGSKNQLSFDQCIRLGMDNFGGLLSHNPGIEAIYQLTYDEDVDNGQLKILHFTYLNKPLQCKAYGDVYGFLSFNKLNIEALLPNKFYNFSQDTDENGQLLNPKQYNIMLEPDDTDRMLMERNRKATEEAKAKAEAETKPASELPPADAPNFPGVETPEKN